MNCVVCGARTFRKKPPLGRECVLCGKSLCPVHTHMGFDRSFCANCAGMVTLHCFFGFCGFVVEHEDPREASALMEAHYDEYHTQDMDPFGGRCGARFYRTQAECQLRSGHPGSHRSDAGQVMWGEEAA